jgi:hypothetical protein
VNNTELIYRSPSLLFESDVSDNMARHLRSILEAISLIAVIKDLQNTSS